MRSRRSRGRLGPLSRLGTLAIISAVLLMVGQLVAWAGSDPTLSGGSGSASQEPAPTRSLSATEAPSPTAEPATPVEGTPTPGQDETTPTGGGPGGVGGAAEDPTSVQSSASDSSAAPPPAGPNTVALDADSHCDRPTGHVIIEATLTNTASQAVDVIATDVTFSGDSEGPVTVAPGDSYLFTFDAGPSPLPGGTVSFDLTWEDGTTETVTARHSPTNACGPTAGPSLSLEKSGPSAVAGGASFSYTVTVTNGGAGAASDVVVTDDLHDALTSVTASTTSGTCTVAAVTNVVTCTIGALGAAGSGTAAATITITATAPSGSCPTITNVATGTHAGGSIPASGSVSTSVTGCGAGHDQPGLNVEKTADAETVDAGQTIGFTIVVTSTGTATATDVTLEDPLPTFTGSSWTIATGSATGCSIASSLLSCSFGDLGAGQTRTVHVTSPTTTGSCGTFPNTATVAASNLSPGTASASVTVVCDQGGAPDIEVVKTARPTHGEPGDTITYAYVVTNTGDTTLLQVTVDDDKLGHICDIARLEPGESRRCTTTWTIPAGASGNVRNVVVAEGTDEFGETVSDRDTAVIDVVLGRTVTPTPPPNRPRTTTPPSGLAFTGPGSPVAFAVAAALLLVVGTGLLWLGRRREEADAAG